MMDVLVHIISFVTVKQGSGLYSCMFSKKTVVSVEVDCFSFLSSLLKFQNPSPISLVFRPEIVASVFKYHSLHVMNSFFGTLRFHSMCIQGCIKQVSKKW